MPATMRARSAMRTAESSGLRQMRREIELERRALLVPDAVVVACRYPERVSPRRDLRIERRAAVPGVDPRRIVRLESIAEAHVGRASQLSAVYRISRSRCVVPNDIPPRPAGTVVPPEITCSTTTLGGIGFRWIRPDRRSPHQPASRTRVARHAIGWRPAGSHRSPRDFADRPARCMPSS